MFNVTILNQNAEDNLKEEMVDNQEEMDEQTPHAKFNVTIVVNLAIMPKIVIKNNVSSSNN